MRTPPLPPRNGKPGPQVIVTVALVPPKKGVFNKEVEHVLAVATTVEVILLAVTYHGKPQETGNARNRRIQVCVFVVDISMTGWPKEILRMPVDIGI